MGITDFVELDRRFRELDRNANREDSAIESYTAGLFGEELGLGWKEIISRRLVVVLGEPGSGKSLEFKQQAATLTKAGQFAFFIHLDQLANEPLPRLFGTEENHRFQRWQKSSAEGLFFLDSVDEAKFQKLSDFHLALDRIQDALGTSKFSRAKILVSSRISEWRPHSDAHELLARFPQPIPPRESKNQDADPVEQLLVVQIAPLDRSRVERFARARGVANVEAFVASLDDQHAWEFARRPIDVIDLAEYWNSHGHLGSLTDLIEYNVKRKLRLSDRDRTDPLTEQQARDGAETLGAATVLCRQLDFKVPDEASLTTEAIDAFRCLPENWRDDQRRALLMRPLFDSATYGRIRFHHRRMSEYLAANWLSKRIQNGCPMTELEHLLCEFVGKRRVIRPALAPVAAWLCNGTEVWRADIRKWVCEADPDIHFQYGDPSRLPLEYKKEILQQLAKISRGRTRLWVNSSSDALTRLADPSLVPDLNGIILDRGIAIDLRIEMLLLVGYGNLLGCLDAVMELLTSDEEHDDLKSHAVAVFRDIAPLTRRKPLSAVAKQLPKLSETLCARFCEALYPEVIEADELTDLLRKAELDSEQSVGLPFYLKEHFQRVVKPHTAGELLAQLIVVAETNPHISTGQGTIQISQEFSWLGEVIVVVLRILLSSPSLTPNEIQSSTTALWMLGHLQHYGDFHDKALGDLMPLASCHPAVRQSFVWRKVSEYRLLKRHEPKVLEQVFDYHQVLRTTSGDFRWLVEDIQTKENPKDSELALRFAAAIWNASGRKWRDRHAIRRAIGNQPLLRQVFAELDSFGRWPRIRRFWYQQVRCKIGEQWWWESNWRKVVRRWRFLTDQLVLYIHLRQLSSGKRLDWLTILCGEAREKDSNRLAPSTWKNLSKKRGKIIEHAAKTGCKRAWRNHKPLLPHEKPDRSVIHNDVTVGLAGLQAAVSTNELNFSDLNQEFSTLAARYALNELNGFPLWFPDFAKAQPSVVSSVLSECIRAEWRMGPEGTHMPEVIYDLVWYGEDLIHLVQDTLLDLLISGDPPNASNLGSVLTALMRQKNPPLEQLAGIVEARVLNSPRTSRGFNFWLTVWVQIDFPSAAKFLNELSNNVPEDDEIIVNLCATLSGEGLDRGPILANASYLSLANLKSFIPLVCRHVRLAEDLNHAGQGAYTPIARDHAQRFRGSLFEKLGSSAETGSTEALQHLLTEPSLVHFRDWVGRMIELTTEKRAELLPWRPEDLRNFEKEHELEPKTDHDLYRIVRNRLDDIRNDVEKADTSIRQDIHVKDDEARLRKWFANQFALRSRKRYTVPQEEEIDQKERPDIRVEHPAIDPISIEIKLAERWSLNELLERLENQLIGQYLRANNSRYGVYLLAYVNGGKQSWKNPIDQAKLGFSEILRLLQDRADTLVAERADVSKVIVVGIDFRDPKTLNKP